MRLRLKADTVGILVEESLHTSVIAPVGEIMKITTWPPGADKMIGVVWDSVNLKMFAEVVQERSEEIRTLSAS
jgi:hypothetical protein